MQYAGHSMGESPETKLQLLRCWMSVFRRVSQGIGCPSDQDPAQHVFIPPTSTYFHLLPPTSTLAPFGRSGPNHQVRRLVLVLLGCFPYPRWLTGGTRPHAEFGSFRPTRNGMNMVVHGCPWLSTLSFHLPICHICKFSELMQWQHHRIDNVHQKRN